MNSPRLIRRLWSYSLSLLLCVAWAFPVNGTGRPFTVADEIGLTDFGDNSYTGKVQAITWSPDRKLVAVHAGRGLLDENKVQSEVRIYAVDALRRFVDAGSESVPPQPLWSILESTYKEGPIIQNIRWTADSSAIAFLMKNVKGEPQLTYGDLESRRLTLLSLADQYVTAFDVRDRTHFVYAVRDPLISQALAIDGQAASVVVTGKPLSHLLFPEKMLQYSERSELWSAEGDAPQRVMNTATGRALILFDEGLSTPTLAPDGNTVLTALAVNEVPKEWERLYPAPATLSSYSIRAGVQNLGALNGSRLVSRYVLIDLRNGKILPLVDAPTGRSAAWFSSAAAAWSPSGKALLLPGVFLSGRRNDGSAIVPCVAEYDVSARTARCLETLSYPYAKDGTLNPSAETVSKLRYADAFGREAIVVEYSRVASGTRGSRMYTKAESGDWRAQRKALVANGDELSIVVKQSYQYPPLLVATNPKSKRSRTIWDPNPQLKGIELGEVSVLRWKDTSGREWVGGVYKPADYREHGRYPLVIQTHNFAESAFRPSGLYPTGYAARALAARGMIVLETRCKVAPTTVEEGPCQVLGYETAVKLLDEQGEIDPERIGIVGFSRTCYYTLEALTRSTLHFKAATITDGVDTGYWQHLALVDYPSGVANEDEVMNGGKPFGDGLQLWLSRAPTFNMEHVEAAMQVVGEGMFSLMYMWEPYALMRYQRKPVDLVLLNTDEHVLTTPAVRLASQGGTVDWMRFWLQGYEDSDPSKAEQYQRWEGLCDLQKAQNPNRPVFCVPSKH